MCSNSCEPAVLIRRHQAPGTARERCDAVLAACRDTGVPAPTVAPATDGGLTLSWRSPHGSSRLTLAGDGRMRWTDQAWSVMFDMFDAALFARMAGDWFDDGPATTMEEPEGDDDVER